MTNPDTLLILQVIRGLNDIKCLAEIGRKGVVDLDVDPTKYDVLFSTIEEKSEQLEDLIDSK